MRNHNCTPKTLADSIKNEHVNEDLQAIYGGAEPPNLDALGDEIPQGKERSFIKTVREGGITAAEVAQAEAEKYTPLTNKKTLEDAQRIIDKDPEAALNRVLSSTEPDVLNHAIGMDLMRRYQNEGRFDKAIQVRNHIAETFTKAGQASQIAAIYDKLTPTGALSYTGKLIDKANEGNKNWKGAKKLFQKAPDIQKAIDDLFGFKEKDATDLLEKALGRKLTPKQVLKSVDFTYLVKQNASNLNKSLESIHNFLVNSMGLTDQEALSVSGKIKQGLEDKLKLASSKYFEKTLKDYSPRQRKTIINSIVEASNAGQFSPDKFRQSLSKKLGLKVLTEDLAKQIHELAGDIQATSNVDERAVKQARLLKLMSSVLPKSKLKQVASLQTMAQLLNVKTAVRNILGNGIFAGIENLAVDPLAAGIDIITSSVTKKRSQVLPRLGEYAKGGIKGAKEGFRDAIEGIDTSGIDTKFDLNHTEQFTNPVLNTIEKGLNITLRTPDRAFYQATFNESLANQMAAAKVTEPTAEMLITAHNEALYRTFQDGSYAAQIFSGLKKAMNVGQDFGLGDFVLKYPKTPGNLLARAFAYSPAGYIEAFGKMRVDLFKNRAFDQRAFVKSVARATVGTVGVGAMGYLLGALHIATGEGDTDKDINAVKKLAGAGKFKINATALQRFIVSGMNPQAAEPREGDELISYDWAQPIAIPFSAGVDLANKKVSAEGAAQEVLQATDSLTDQGVLQGVQNFFGARGADGKFSLGQAATNAISDAPSSFVPTAVNQANQLIDNTNKETTSPNVVEQSINKVKAKIPGLAQTLPDRYNVLGQKDERYQDGSNNLFNVLANPAFVSRLKSSPVTNEVLRIFNKTGETQQAPHVVDKKITIIQNGKQVKLNLNGEQISQYQKYVGHNSNNFIGMAMQSPFYKILSDGAKADAISEIIGHINTAAKVKLFKSENPFGKNPDYLITGLLMKDKRYVQAGIQKILYDKAKGEYMKKVRPQNNYQQLIRQ